LADVLGHEIIHITKKHTLRAIQKAKSVSAAAGATRQQFIESVANKGYEFVIENQFDQSEEGESDKEGVTLANTAGYAPGGLAGFLTRLADRNKGLKERSGLFASHRDTQTRLNALERVIKSGKLTAAALVTARYDQAIDFTLLPVDQIPQGGASTSGGSSSSSGRTGGSGALGLGGLNPLASSKSSGAVSSAASRGVNPDRDAKGGPNKGLVVITVTAAEIAEFRKGIV
jgi:predicted Zn-dependent protease